MHSWNYLVGDNNSMLYILLFYIQLLFPYDVGISHASVQHDFNMKPSAMQKNMG